MTAHKQRPSTTEPRPLEQLLTLQDAEEVLQMSRTTVLRLIDRGDLVAYKIGHQWRIEPDDLRAFLAAARHPSRTGWSAKPAGQRGVA